MKKKWCWIAKQNKFKHWRVFFCAGNTEYALDGLDFGTEKDVSKVLPKGKVVFVHDK